MGSRFNHDYFDRAEQRAQKRTDEVVRKFRHKKQNVFRRGEMFRADLYGFYFQNQYGMFSRFSKLTGPMLLIALSDSDQYVTHVERNVSMGFDLALPYHFWPFMWNDRIVLYVVSNSFDPMAVLRGSFSRLFKIVK